MSFFKEKDNLLRKAYADLNRTYSDSDDDYEEKESEHIEDKQPDVTIKQQSQNDLVELDLTGDEDCEMVSCSAVPAIVDVRQTEDEVINISDDDDNQPSSNETTILSEYSFPNVSQEDEEFHLRLRLVGSMRQFRTFYKIPFKESLAELLTDLQKEGKRLLLTYDGNQTELEDSPQSLQLTPGSILDGFSIPLEEGRINKQPPVPQVDPNTILLKIQDGNRRNTKEIRINKQDTMLTLKKAYSKACQIGDVGLIKLSCDGDVLDDESTAEELDLDDGFMIDATVNAGH